MYPKKALQQDYTLFRTILEKKHPALYWYTPKEEMDRIFDAGYESISDSMTELMFGWKVLAPVTAAIHCGHTGFGMSPRWNRYIKYRLIPSFPLELKVWKDTMMVMADLNRGDSVMKRGTLITSINGIGPSTLIPYMMDYMVEDGYADNVNYIRLSTGFPYFHRNIFGLYKKYRVGYLDSTGKNQVITLPYFNPLPDSLAARKDTVHRVKKSLEKSFHLTHKQKLEAIRSFQMDTGFALMTLNAFSKGHLRHFFQKTFRTLRKSGQKNLVIDIRANGGGDINKYVLLTKFLRKTPFRVADSAYSVSRNFAPYTRYLTSGFFANIGLRFLTHRESDGKYHFRYWERHTFRPKRKNHFNGHLYLLTNGLTFSAATLFCNAVKGQDNVTLVGEETGGGWYGNSGIIIPEIKLPHTGLRVRLPFFRIVQYHHIGVKGTGVMPDVYIGPRYEDLIRGVDTKMEWVKRHIRKSSLVQN